MITAESDQPTPVPLQKTSSKLSVSPTIAKKFLDRPSLDFEEHKFKWPASSKYACILHKARSWPPAICSLDATDVRFDIPPHGQLVENPDLTIESVAAVESSEPCSEEQTPRRSKSWSEISAKTGSNENYADAASTLSRSGSRSTLANRASDDSALTHMKSPSIGHKRQKASFRAIMSKRWAAVEQKLRHPSRRERFESLLNAARKSRTGIRRSPKGREREFESISEQEKFPVDKPDFITNPPHELSVSPEYDDLDTQSNPEDTTVQDQSSEALAQLQDEDFPITWSDDGNGAKRRRRSVMDLEGNVLDSEGTPFRIVRRHRSGKRWVLREPSIELYDIKEEAGSNLK